MSKNINTSKLNKHIGEYIKRVMSDKKITQQNLAEYLHIGQPTVNSYLNDNASIPVDNLFRICHFLGISMDKVTGLNEILNFSENISLSNVCESLSNLNDMVPLKFSKIEIGKKSYDCIYSDCKNVNDTVRKFGEIIDCSDGDENVFYTWKKSFIEKNKEKLKKYDFNTKDGISKQLFDCWIELTRIDAEFYRQASDNSSYKAEHYEQFVKICEMAYNTSFRGTASFLYNTIDNYIKDYPKNSAEYIASITFKKVHEENQITSQEDSSTSQSQDGTI